ncbi:NUDIX hydrolase [Actinomadura sp. NBRC 104412]|uniref:NUDIX domain-containing protein n=1 Tax=Actinomadura sp. NBRC 104412 TaxID=3032203 RepID=UPI0024A5C609|nr:NUDIX hydrolase [Actinomadura sp. NBRC 104412]GLZ08074.1 NUDIX hydrolase [Actinomadura sp. NBRC 104412]
MSDRPLFERDPNAWRDYLAEGNATQPRKRIGADLLLRNEHGDCLLVDPRYKPDWDMPGGMSESNEAPDETVRRELLEELGLEVTIGPLLVVDWVSPHDPWDDSLIFIFDGGVLDDSAIANLRLSDNELQAYDFCDRSQAATRLRPYVWRRLQVAFTALETGRARYTRDGF